MVHVGVGSDIGFVVTGEDGPQWYVATMAVWQDVKDDPSQAQYVPTALGAALAGYLEATQREVRAGLTSLMLKEEAVPRVMRHPRAGWVLTDD
jgi:hypothetical protein